MLDFAPSPGVVRFAFGKYDEVKIGGISYRPIDKNDSAYVFAPASAIGVAESYTHAELARLVDQGAVEHNADAFLPENARNRASVPSTMLSTLSPEQHERAKIRESVVRAFLKLEGEGTVNRTHASVQAALAQVRLEAARYLSVASEGAVRQLQANTMVIPSKVSSSALMRWLRAYESRGIGGLYDRVANRGNRCSRLREEELGLMASVVKNYLSDQRPSQVQIHTDVQRVFREENKRRAAEGRPDLVPPSRETVRRAINDLDPFHVHVARYGLASARKKYAPVGKGLELTRPLERVEMDEWEVDLIKLVPEMAAPSFLSD